MRGRRAFLALCGTAALSTLGSRVAAAPRKKLVDVERTKLGTTLTFDLDRAPFPSDAERYKDGTVLVFVPKHYRLPKHDKADLVVHFHGHVTTARRALEEHALREQLHESKQNALLVVPQLALNAADSDPGKLDEKGGLERLLRELVKELKRPKIQKALGKATLETLAGPNMLCLSAHSGGYRAAAACLARGRRRVHETYLFDSLYGEVDTFRRWVVAKKDERGRRRHKLVSHYASSAVRDRNLELLAQLEREGVRCLHEQRPGTLTRAELTKGTAVFIASPLGHGQTTFAHNNLRDCLFASGLRRRLDSDWFDDADTARAIEARQTQ
jgi:hypothetical protein